MKKKLFTGFVILLIALQLIPVERDNPPVHEAETLKMPPKVQSIVQRACYDCHSNTTRWPWYSYVAPVSFFVAHHVEEGRDELNFSKWSTYSAKRKSKKLKEIREQVKKGKMPLYGYVLLHPDAALSESDIQLIKTWTEQADTLYVKTEKKKE
ncbi:MAG: heme-binding protein [Calditrichaeota bacterium]|nr:MAG: heme-binding protein [Calditrichota bacterium]